METTRVNEETPDGNYVIEILSDGWKYITTEFSASTATQVATNLNNATNKFVRVLSRRSNNMVICELTKTS